MDRRGREPRDRCSSGNVDKAELSARTEWKGRLDRFHHVWKKTPYYSVDAAAAAADPCSSIFYGPPTLPYNCREPVR